MAQVLKLTREQIPMMIKGIASPCGSIYLAAARTAICCYRSQGAADRRVIWGHLRANHVKETFRNLDLLIVNVRGNGIGSSNCRFQPRSATVPRRADVSAAMIAHGAKHSRLQIPKGHVVRKAAGVDLGVVVAVRISASKSC
jgi:hypothetical protein